LDLTVEITLIIRIYFSAIKDKYHESKAKRHRLNIESDGRRRAKARQKRPNQKKRKVRWTSFLAELPHKMRKKL